MNNKFKIISYILCVFLLTPNFFSGADAIEKVRIRDSELFEYFDVYTDNGSSLNHFYPSGWMGDTNDIDLVENCTNNPYSGRTCLKINYTAKATQGKKWAGIYWQDPGNNWGDKKGGFDLTGMEELVFYARGENGSEIGEFKIGGINRPSKNDPSKPYKDSVGPISTGKLILSKEWERFFINLSGKNLSHIIGGFCWVTNKDSNPNGCTIYLDDIRYNSYRDETSNNILDTYKKPFGIAYGPYRDLGPNYNEMVNFIDIDEDMELLKNLKIPFIRTYGCSMGLWQIPKIANKYGIKCFTGIYLGNSTTVNENEIKNLSLALPYSDAIIVGNEALLFPNSTNITESDLINYIEKVRKITSKPITYADTWFVWKDHPNLVNYVDFITIHIYPFWDGVSIDNAIDYTFQRYNEVKNKYPNKEVILGEIGWPSNGSENCTIEIQSIYYKNILPKLLEYGIGTFFFEAFDERWKIETEGGVGPHWGIYYQNRVIKKTGLILNNFIEKSMIEDADNDSLNDLNEYINHSTDPYDNDTDHDDMPDGWEVIYGLNPLFDDRLLDPDFDNFTNIEEFLNGTDPRDNDTDHDGMPDDWEVQFNLDPLNDDKQLDFDFDNLTNIEEFLNGSDPRDNDTDLDRMPDGWEVNYGFDPLNDDKLLDPDFDNLTNIDEYLNKTDPRDNDTDHDGIPDGWEVQFNLDPLNDDKLLDFDFDNLTNIEEFLNGTDPRNNDTDHDGMPDDWEIKYGLNPLNNFDSNFDMDHDGLKNLDEYFNKTDPSNIDSDGDNYFDKIEIDVGTDPNDNTDYPAERKSEKDLIKQTNDLLKLTILPILIIILILLFIGVLIKRRSSKEEDDEEPEEE